MTSTFLLEHSPIGSGITKHEMAPGEKIKSVLSQATPIGQTPANIAKRSTRKTLNFNRNVNGEEEQMLAVATNKIR